MTTGRTAVVVGVGAELGLGAGLARRLAREGYRVFVAGRAIDKLVQVARTISDAGGDVIPVVADATSESDLASLFDYADDDGSLDLVVFNAGEGARHEPGSGSPQLFEQSWRLAALGGFLVGLEVARRLVPRRRGTAIFTGAIVDEQVAFASARAALRSVVQSMARELAPLGVHVAQVFVDGVDGAGLNLSTSRGARRGEDGLLNIEAIADACWNLHHEHRSAWTHELNLRPFRTTFQRTWRENFNKTGVNHGPAE
jgi:NAD(P)-dependent dehydrogenase (short-subunit alcohol dehydrogenase family)